MTIAILTATWIVVFLLKTGHSLRLHTSHTRITSFRPALSGSGGVDGLPASRRGFLTAVGTGATLLASHPLVAAAASAGSTAAGTTLPGGRANVLPPPVLPLPLTQAQEALGGLVSGSLVSSTKILVKHPLDTVGVRLQVAQRDGLGTPRRAVLFRGLYSGVVPPLVFGIPSGALFFSVKDGAKAALRARGVPKEAATLLSVLAAQFPYWLLRNPSEVLKTRAQAAGLSAYGAASTVGLIGSSNSSSSSSSSSSSEAGFWAAVRAAAVSDGGLASLWQGYGENIAAAYPADALKFVIYEALTTGRGVAKASVPPLKGAALGALATALSQAVTTPLDVVRNRAMLREGPSAATPAAAAAEKTDRAASGGNAGAGADEASFALAYWRTLQTIAREEGAGALWIGLSPRIGKSILSGAIQFGTYEVTKGSMSKFFAATTKR